MSAESEFIQILGAEGDKASGPSRVAEPTPPEVLPILGLADVVIYPGIVAPLIVDSASSIKLVDDVVAGDRFVGLMLQKKAEVDNPTPEDLYRVGCVARVLRMLKFPDNTVRVLVEGLWRMEVTEFVAREPYLKAKAVVRRETPDDSIETTALYRNLRKQFDEVIALSPSLAEQVKVSVLNTDDPGRIADLIAANINIKLEERQRLLETLPVRERLSALVPLMHRELQVLQLGSKIQDEVSTAMSKSQRDYFLREQMRAIQRELGEGEGGTSSEITALRKQIADAKLPPDAERIANKELERLAQMPTAAPDYTVLRNYLDFLVALPWSKSTEDKIDLHEAGRILDEQHFGLSKVKDRLLEFIAVVKLKKQIKGPILCLVGPPGVGKTSLGKSVADALGRKFVRIALGGMRDEAEIRGHRRTYVGALPGRILQSLRRVESHNPVVLLDELDKIGSDFRGDPASALLEVLDPQQNHTFTDHYLDLPFDLSRVLFIATANWMDPVHPALRDRLEVIELPSYTVAEKLQIAKRHLLPRQLEEHGLKPKLLRISDSALQRLVQDYTREAGVRQLEREIANLVRKAARHIVATGTPTKPMTIKGENIESYLGAPKFVAELAEAITEAGIAIGLAWTPVGGDILFIEATRMPGKGRLTLTGSLGDVMKESAQAALSYLRSHAKPLGIDTKLFEEQDIHVHVPAGATPKDGPSAGTTMTTALASLFMSRRVRSDLAMTGEISLRGRVLPVGGIKEKVLAASRSGLKHVILPEQNRKDWNEIPAEVKQKIEAHFVRDISQLLELALRRK